MASESSAKRKDFIAELETGMRGNSTNYIDVMMFRKAVVAHFHQVGHKEMSLLERKYEHPNDPMQFNY